MPEDNKFKSISFKEQRIRKITHLYYSRPDVQKAIFEFCQNREVSPRYFEGFGKRPDSFQYSGDIFQLVKKGATSFHCSEEIWEDPLEIESGMNELQANELRIGWDLLIDIDCKWFDYSKLAVQSIIKVLNDNHVKNIGIKFSGSKGWHVLIPWKSFPREINGIETSNLFPELPRKIISYLRYYSGQKIKESLPEDFYSQFKDVKIKKGIKCKECNEIAQEYERVELYCEKCRRGEIRKFLREDKKENYFCPECKSELIPKDSRELFECNKCNLDSNENPSNFSASVEVDLYELIGLDLVLVSPRHLFRAPYSLHEKTALASVVLSENEIDEFQLRDADPMKAQIRNFMPEVKEGEASELVMQALDWSKDNEIISRDQKEKITGKYVDFKPIKLDNISEDNFPLCVKNILKGNVDGKKRALFILINLFRSIGMEKEELEKRIEEWNKKNNPPLKQGYITSQLLWAYRRKPVMPPNCKEFYQGIGMCQSEEFCRTIKNPVSYVIKKSLSSKKKKMSKKTKT
ncbi:MAG: hypothetical protein ABH811_00045 [archaeon]